VYRHDKRFRTRFNAVKAVSIREVMHGNVLVLTVSRVLWSMSESVVRAYLSLYILALGGSATIIGLINSIGSLSASLLYPIGGYIADKAGRAKLVGVATILYITSFLVLASAPSWEWVAFGVVYQQMVLFYMPALNAIMADSIPRGARGRIYSFTVAIPEAVRIMTPYIGGYLISVYTLQPAMRIGYTLGFAIGLVVAFIRIRYLKETISSRQGIGRNIPRIFKEGYSNVFSSIKWIFGNIRGYAVVAMCLAFMSNLIVPFWVVYARQVIGLSAYEWGVVLLLGGMVKTVMSFVIGNLVDRLGVRRCFSIGFALGVAPMILYTQATSFAQVVLIYLVILMANSFIWISSPVFLANSVPRPMRGRILASMGQGMTIGVAEGGYSSGFLSLIPMSIGSFVGGFVYSFNPVFPWLMQAGYLAVAFILSLKIIQEPEKPEE